MWLMPFIRTQIPLVVHPLPPLIRTIYTQMSSMFVTQGSVMKRDVVWQGCEIKVPSASMAVFNTVAIIVLVGFGVAGMKGVLHTFITLNSLRHKIFRRYSS